MNWCPDWLLPGMFATMVLGFAACAGTSPSLSEQALEDDELSGTLPAAPIATARTVVELDEKITSFSVTADYIYFTTERALYRSLRSGGGKPEVVAADQHQPVSVSADVTHVFWTEYASGTVWSMTHEGGEKTLIFEGLRTPLGLAIDDTSVYVSEHAPAGKVWKFPREGGGEGVALAEGLDKPKVDAVDNRRVFWTTLTRNGAVMSVDIGGGTPVTIAKGQNLPHNLAVDLSTVYWVSTEFVRSAPIEGGEVIDLADGQTRATGIAIADGSVYWTDADSGAVRSHSDDKGVELIIGGEGLPGELAAEDGGLYWIDDGRTSIRFMRL